jgi:hypothetical protein
MKTFFITLNLIALSLTPFLFIGNVTVEHEGPATIEAGGSAEITITLNKSNITGPAKVKLDFGQASGLTAEQIQTSGASFSFADEAASFTWISIEPTSTITLKYLVKAASNATGLQTISGKFQFMDEDERKTIPIPSIIIEVKNNGNAIATESTVSSVPTSTTPTSNTPIGDISCSRTIEKSGKEFIVTLNLSKGNNKGFARIKENIPSGFTAKESQNAGAVFKFVDNSVKFLWTQIPTDKSSLVLKYKLIPPAGASGEYAINGEFSGEFLVVNDVPTGVEIPMTKFTVSGSSTEQLANNSDKSSNNSTNNSNNASNNSTNSSNSGSSAEKEDMNGIKFKVQVVAGHSTLSPNSIKRKYNYDGNITIENHEGWVKYCTGLYTAYKDAKSKRNELSGSDFPGPFVVAYNNGNRISVQEALAISSQSWVK